MKKTLLILSIIFVISCKKESGAGTQKHETTKDSVSVKNNSPNVESDSIRSVEDIKKEYAAVNSLLSSKKLDSSNFTYYCNEKEGEVVIYKRMVKSG